VGRVDRRAPETRSRGSEPACAPLRAKRHGWA
jgi:hypothetical protein